MMQSLRRAVGKSIKSCCCLREPKSIKSRYEFIQQGGRFRSTSSSFLLPYPKIGISSLHSIYGRSFSSRPIGDVVDEVPIVDQLFDSDIIISGGGGGGVVVDEVSKVPLVEQLFDCLTSPVGCTLVVGMIIAFSLSRRLLKSWLVKRPDSYFYHDLKDKTSLLITFAALISIPCLDSLTDMIIIIGVATCTHKATGMLLDELDQLEDRLSLPFSVGDTIKIRKELPFSVGDTIKIRKKTRYGEAKVLEIDRIGTTLLATAENLKLYAPNSDISKKIIVRSIVKIIQLKIDDGDKIPRISEDITSMLKLNPNVCLEMEVPYCSCVQERSYLELTLKYDLILKDKMAEKDVLLSVVGIIKEHGGELISNPSPLGVSVT